MKRAQRTANQTRSQFQKSFGGLGGIVKAGFAGVISGLSIGLITQGIKAALEYAGSLGEISQQLGVTTRDLQVFRYAAGQVGVSQEQLETGLSKLTITLGKVAAGAKAPAAALNAIGISVDQLKGKDTGEAFRIIADGLEKVTDRSQRAAVEVALFGKSGAMLDNLLSGGSRQVNELAAAADRLGIVLSDEQIQKADETADKLEAIKTVLSAKIAGVVADNAGAIFTLADSLSQVAAEAVQAAGAMVNFANNAPSWAKRIWEATKLAINPIGALAGAVVDRAKQPGSSVTTILGPAPKKAAPSRAISPFLAGGGGGGRKRGGSDDAERKRQEALRNAYQFDQDMRRAQMDTLRAQQSLATDYTDRANIGIELLNLDQQGYQAELDYQVASGEISKAKAGQLKAEYDKRDALERQAVRAEEEAQRAEDFAHLEQVDFDLQRDLLQSQEQLADTAQKQRDVRLRLLDLDYRQERARLETILADEKASYAAKEEARRRLANLNKTFGNDRQAVIRDTAGPFEQAKMQFGDLSEEMENLRVNGIMAAGDALATLATEGFGSFKEAAISAIKAVIAEFIRLQAIKMLFSVIGGGTGGGVGGGSLGNIGAGLGGGIPGFATGGGFNVMGRGGIDNNVLSLNGLPIARVSHGERVSVSNDSASRGGNVSIPITIMGNVSRETAMQVGAKVRMAVAQANRKGA